MQASGISVGVVQTGQDLFEDPQLKYQGEFAVLNHTEIGTHSCRTPAYKLSKNPCYFQRSGPCLGEHNEYVFKEILGLSDDEIADLLIEGVITTDDDLP